MNSVRTFYLEKQLKYSFLSCSSQAEWSSIRRSCIFFTHGELSCCCALKERKSKRNHFTKFVLVEFFLGIPQKSLWKTHKFSGNRIHERIAAFCQNRNLHGCDVASDAFSYILYVKMFKCSTFMFIRGVCIWIWLNEMFLLIFRSPFFFVYMLTYIYLFIERMLIRRNFSASGLQRVNDV